MIETANGSTANATLNSDVSKGGKGKADIKINLIYKSHGRIK